MRAGVLRASHHAIRNTQHAPRTPLPTLHTLHTTQYAIRNTQYSIRNNNMTIQTMIKPNDLATEKEVLKYPRHRQKIFRCYFPCLFSSWPSFLLHLWLLFPNNHLARHGCPPSREHRHTGLTVCNDWHAVSWQCATNKRLGRESVVVYTVFLFFTLL